MSSFTLINGLHDTDVRVIWKHFRICKKYSKQGPAQSELPRLLAVNGKDALPLWKNILFIIFHRHPALWLSVRSNSIYFQAKVDPQIHLPHRRSTEISLLPYPSRLAHMQIPFDIPFGPFGKFQKTKGFIIIAVTRKIQRIQRLFHLLTVKNRIIAYAKYIFNMPFSKIFLPL